MRAVAGQMGFAAFGVRDLPAPAPASQRWIVALLTSLPVGTEHAALEWGFVVRLLDDGGIAKPGYEAQRDWLKGLGFVRYESFDVARKLKPPHGGLAHWYGYSITWGRVEAHTARASRPAPSNDPPPLTIRGVTALDEIALDGMLCTVIGLDDDGMVLRGDAHDEDRDVLWTAIEQERTGHWRSKPVVPYPAHPHAAPSTSPSRAAKPKLHRQTPEPAADDLAQRGVHVYAVLIDGEWTRIERRSGEKAPAWAERARTEVAQDARVRVYDGAPRCTWDSLDGGAP